MYLLDTNVLVELVRRRPSVRLAENLRRHAGDPLFTSVISVMELRHGAMRRDDRETLWRRVENELLPLVEVLAIGIEEAMRAGDLLAHLRRTGQPIDVEDILIGATALTHALTAVTNNVAHFRRIPGLRVEDWMGE